MGGGGDFQPFIRGEQPMKKTVFVVLCAVFLTACGENQEPTKASQSEYEHNIRRATTSDGLSKVDLAWHAKNTYGWDCSEVISEGEMTADGYFFIECSSGNKFRVYPRAGKHPKITNEGGTYKRKVYKEYEACVDRGVAYFKSVGSYPTLQSYPNKGRQAEDVAAERCKRTVTAF